MTTTQSQLDFFGNALPRVGSHFNIFECDAFRSRPVHYSRRDFYKITLQFGSSRLEYADKGILIDGPALIFTNPLIPYCWEPISGDQKGYFVLFTESFLHQTSPDQAIAKSSLFAIGSDPVYHIGSDQVDYVFQIFKNMEREMVADYPYRDNLLRNHLHLLMHEALKMQPVANYTNQQKSPGKLAEIFTELIDRQFPVSLNEPLVLRTPRQFAQRLGIHVNHLNRSVREATGKTTSELLAERIITEARLIIANTSLNIAEISYMLGYEYPTYFNNFFKKHTGTTPASLR